MVPWKDKPFPTLGNRPREMDAFFEKNGPCEILVVNQQCEPDNELLGKLNKL